MTQTKHPDQLKTIRSLSYWLDNAIPIPGTGYRVGLDPILGLIPGGGDIIGAILAAYLVFKGVQLRLPAASLGRMVWNIVLEMVVGLIPVVGDLFDFAWKANAKNLELLEAHLDDPQIGREGDRWFFVLVLGGLAVIVLIVTASVFVAFRLLLALLGGS
jgi:hypothetical protein